jgi:hypothetical protein
VVCFQFFEESDTPTLPPFSSIEAEYNRKFVQGILEIAHGDGLAYSTVDKIAFFFRSMAQESRECMRRYLEDEFQKEIVEKALDRSLIRK